MRIDILFQQRPLFGDVVFLYINRAEKNKIELNKIDTKGFEHLRHSKTTGKL